MKEEHKEKIRQAHLARNAEKRNTICDMALQGESIKEIAKHLNTTYTSVKEILFRAGVKAKRGPNPKKGTIKNPERDYDILKSFESANLSELSQKYNLSVNRIRNILKRNGIKFTRIPWNTNPEKKQEICTLRQKGVSIKQIAEQMDCVPGYISRILTENGIRSHKPKRTDGRYIDRQGYEWVRIEDDDPMVAMRNKGCLGRISKHRLVMARTLGRPLTKDETVHHIDGDKLNNHPDNLQLRFGKHGAGQRMQCIECESFNITMMECMQCVECGSTRLKFTGV